MKHRNRWAELAMESEQKKGKEKDRKQSQNQSLPVVNLPEKAR